MRNLIVGTRRSQLALTQTNWVINELKKIDPTLQIETKIIVTKGDRLQKSNIPLSKVGGKGLFLKEIEQALLNGEIDFAVHSMKDVPAQLPMGLSIGSIPKREDASDCLVSKRGLTLDELPTGSVIGSSSLRRQSQILAYRSDLIVKPLRGNIGTRIQKMKDGSYDAAVLATAGLVRVGWTNEITQRIPTDIMVPAIGQGALMVECREDDSEVYQLLQQIHHHESAQIAIAERAFQTTFQGGCQLPVAAYGKLVNHSIALTGWVAAPNGEQVIKGHINGLNPYEVGYQLAQRLLDKGAGEIIERVNTMIENALQQG